MNLYLFNQKRDRDLTDYLSKLCISNNEFQRINHRETQLLLVGGGYSLLKPLFHTHTTMTITNIDLDPPQINDCERLVNIKGDFTRMDPYVDQFDEIWALYSLPLYCPDQTSVYLFLMKSILAIKQYGNIRFFPLEFDCSNIMNTKDADYDITAAECTNCVLDVLKMASEFGITCKRKNMSAESHTRIEESVVLTLECSIEKKMKINSLILERINAHISKHSTESRINVFTSVRND